MKKKSLLLFFLLSNLTIFCQNQIKDAVVTYQISACKKPQNVILTKFNDSTYSGIIVYSGYKYKGKYSFESSFHKNFREINSLGEKISDTLQIENKKAEVLFKLLKENGIEDLKKEELVYQYNSKTKSLDLILFPDPCTTSFIIKTKEKEINTYFEDIEVIIENKDINAPIINKERVKAQRLYSILNKEINLIKNWEDYQKGLKK